jgi:hypothetical protein
MEFLIPILFAVAKKSLAALLVTLFLFTSLRIADKRSGIDFKATWNKLHEHYQVRYLCVRMVCFTVVFIFTFTIA